MNEEQLVLPLVDDDMDERFTPPEVYEPLDRLFQFTLDPCTTEDNPLGTMAYITKQDDGLKSSWEGMKVFVNPPYSQMRKWAMKAVEESRKGAFVAFILPNDCSTWAWRLLKVAGWGQWNVPFRVKFRTASGKKRDVARSHVVFFLGGLK